MTPSAVAPVGKSSLNTTGIWLSRAAAQIWAASVLRLRCGAPSTFAFSVERIPVKAETGGKAVVLGKAAGVLKEVVENFSAMEAVAEGAAQQLIEGLPDQFRFGDAESFRLALEGAVLLFGDVELLADHGCRIYIIYIKLSKGPDCPRHRAPCYHFHFLHLEQECFILLLS